MAWQATAGRQFAKDGIPLPIEDFMRAGAATAGAMMWWKFPPHGLGMTVTVQCGQLMVFIGRPKVAQGEDEPCTQDSYDAFAITELLNDCIISPNKSSPEFWDTEMVILTSGTTL